MAIKDWKIEQLTGYKPHKRFYVELSMAEPFGISAIANTYDRLFVENKHDPIFITELSMAVNWKVYEHYDKEKWIYKLYQSMWEQIDNHCKQNLKGNDLEYYNKCISDYCSW